MSMLVEKDFHLTNQVENQNSKKLFALNNALDVSDRKDESGGETPSLADHSGNTTPAGTRKTKVKNSARR